MMHQYHIFCILVFHKDENVENLTVTPTLEGNEEVCVLLKSAVAVFLRKLSLLKQVIRPSRMFRIFT